MYLNELEGFFITGPGGGLGLWATTLKFKSTRGKMNASSLIILDSARRVRETRRAE